MGLEDKLWDGKSTYNPAGSASLVRTYREESVGGSMWRYSDVTVTANAGYKITDIEYDEEYVGWYSGSEYVQNVQHRHLTYQGEDEVAETLKEQVIPAEPAWGVDGGVWPRISNVKITCINDKPPGVNYFIYAKTTIEPDAARQAGCTASYTDRTRLWMGGFPSSDITVTRSAAGTAKWRFSHWYIADLLSKFTNNPLSLHYQTSDYRRQYDGSYVWNLNAIAVFERVYTGELLYGSAGKLLYGSAGKLVYSG